MKWNSMTDRLLISLLKSAIEDAEDIKRTCLLPALRKIDRTTDKLRIEVNYLEKADDKYSAVASSRARNYINDLYVAYRQIACTFITRTQLPYNADGLLDDEIAGDETLKIDKEIDGIFVFEDGNMLRIRTPALPHKNKPKMLKGSRNGPYEVKITGAYSEAVYRALTEKYDELQNTIAGLGYKTIHFLNVFEDPVETMDNDNRDTGRIVNSICSFLPNGDIPTTTRMVHDGRLSYDLIPGTYITILPYNEGMPDNDATLNFWQNKIAEIGYKQPSLCD